MTDERSRIPVDQQPISRTVGHRPKDQLDAGVLRAVIDALEAEQGKPGS